MSARVGQGSLARRRRELGGDEYFELELEYRGRAA